MLLIGFMPRTDLIIELVRNSLSRNKYKVKTIVDAMIADERAKQHHVLADKLQSSFEEAMKLEEKELPSNNNFEKINRNFNQSDFLEEIKPKRTFDDLILPKNIIRRTEELIEEQFRSDLLRSYGLEPSHKVLLIGEPGTGKTSYAEALANKLVLPLYIVRYDSLIGSYLGETASRLRNLIDFASKRKCVLFFDEFDTIGKERGDEHEVGEIKRVVSSLLMMMDSLPSYTIIIAASNHAELLDRAVWRRFQIKLNFPMPNSTNIEKWLLLFSRNYNINFQIDLSVLSKKLSGLNYGDIENFAFSVARHKILSLPNKDNNYSYILNLLESFKSKK